MTFSFTLIKNSRPPSCVPLRNLQLLSETFFSKLNSVWNIRLSKLKWVTVYNVLLQNVWNHNKITFLKKGKKKRQVRALRRS